MSGRVTAIAAMASLALVLSHCATPQSPPIQTGTPVPEARPGHVISLDQGWTEQQQQGFWFTSQGSRLLPYDWYLALERAGSPELFRSTAHMEEIGYLPESPSPINPDGLPVGFAKDTDPATGKAWVGFTCAACHSNQIDYQGTRMRIDGAPTLADNFRFSDEMVAALQATVNDGEKFDRFARKVLGPAYSPDTAGSLRDEVRKAAGVLDNRQRQDKPPYPYGHARLDAFGAIFNQVLADDLDIPRNAIPADAPVSYPFLWDTAQSDLVQWNGSAPNAGVGPLLRNVGEVLGVYASVDVQPKNGRKGYPSSAKILDLAELEKTLAKLWSPQWPAGILPAVDAAKAAQGQPLFQQHCAKCHALIDRTSPKRRVTAVMNSVEELGTDPTMADNFVDRAGKTGRLEGHKVFIIAGATFGEEATGLDILTNVVAGTVLAQKAKAVEAGLDEYLKIKQAKTFAPRSYKARSLNGIWATAPYLHNGSVPSLWQLLQAPDQRVKDFQVGSRQFDPVNVGFDATGSFHFDTRLPGNSNAGHTYGTQLSDDQKWALVEYLKTL